MGIVYEARDTHNGSAVALKQLSIAQALSGTDRRQVIERFYREAKAAGSLVHPNIAQVYDAGEFNGTHYLTMEYCAGVTLRDMLKFEHHILEAKLRDIADQVLSALEVAHAAKIVHRDIKPDNIIVGANGRVKLMDFGIAKTLTNGTMTQTGQVMGSPAYMSPEQVLGKPVDARTDLFSFGVVLYECLSGKKPFDGETVTAVAHSIIYVNPEPLVGVPAYLNAIVTKALSKEPGSRYQNATEMRSDLKQKRTPMSPQPRMAQVQNQTVFAAAPPPVTLPQPQPVQSYPPQPPPQWQQPQYQQPQYPQPQYGQSYPPQPYLPVNQKNPWVAWALDFFLLTGLGFWLAGMVAQGFAALLIVVVCYKWDPVMFVVAKVGCSIAAYSACKAHNSGSQMALGQCNREIFVAREPRQVYSEAKLVMETIGRVREDQPSFLSFDGKTRYGMQSITLRVSVLPDQAGSKLVIRGSGDDVWGLGAAKAMDNFMRTYRGFFVGTTAT